MGPIDSGNDLMPRAPGASPQICRPPGHQGEDDRGEPLGRVIHGEAARLCGGMRQPRGVGQPLDQEAVRVGALSTDCGTSQPAPVPAKARALTAW